MLLLLIAMFAKDCATGSADVVAAADNAAAYVAKQANRTNSIHSSRIFYPDRVFTPTGHRDQGTDELAQWHGAHAPGSWTSGFWVGVNWSVHHSILHRRHSDSEC